MAISGIGGIEILQIIEAVSREKSIPRESITRALEDALKIAAKRKYGNEQQIKAEINRKTGEIKIYKEILVVADQSEADKKYLDDNLQAIPLAEARMRDSNINVGDIICELLPAMEIGRIAAQSAKQVIMAKVKEIEHDIQYEEFKDKIGHIVSGVVDKVDYKYLTVKLSSTAEAIIRKDNLLKADHFKHGDRIKAYLLEIDRNTKGLQIILSRTHEQFVAMLFTHEVPEIYEKIIQIKGVARDPGSRTKIAVYSSDPAIDAVGSCVGIRGGRVQSIISELKGEKIDIVNWTADLGNMIINSLTPANIIKILIDEDQHKVEIIVPDDQQSVAIGRQGQNVRLASKLVGWRLDILTEEAETSRRQDEFNTITQKFIDALGLEEILAQLLASEGYNSINSIANIDINTLVSHGLDHDTALELINRANEYVKSHQYSDVNNSSQLRDFDDSPLLRISMMTKDLARLLHTNDVNQIIDVADLSREDFKDLLPNVELDDSTIDTIIMDARKRTYFNKNNQLQ